MVTCVNRMRHTYEFDVVYTHIHPIQGRSKWLHAGGMQCTHTCTPNKDGMSGHIRDSYVAHVRVYTYVPHSRGALSRYMLAL